MNYAWPAALAFAAMCAAVAYAMVHTPPSPPHKDAQIVCFEQRGKWVGGGWGGSLAGTCDFSATAANK